MFFKEYSGRDLFSIVFDANNEEPLKFRDPSGNKVEFKQVFVRWYNDDDREKSTFVVLELPDGQSMDVGQIVRMSDGSTALVPDIDDEIKLTVVDDYMQLKNEWLRSEKYDATVDTATVNKDSGNKTRDRKSKKIERLPNMSWYSNNGVPIEQIPIDKSVLKRKLSEEQKTMVAVTTYPILIRNCFIVLGAFMAAAIVAVVLFLTLDGVEFGISLLVVVFGGSFLIQKLSCIYDGFDILCGTWRIKMPIGYHILYRLTAPIAMLWSALSILIYKLIGKNEKFKLLMMPRIGVPKGCGLDNIINVYKKYEADVDKIDALAIQREAEEKKKEEHSQKAKKLTAEGESIKKELQEQFAKDGSMETYGAIKEIDSKIEKLKKSQKEYEKSESEKVEKLRAEEYDLRRQHYDDINNL